MSSGAGGLIIGPAGTYNVDNLTLPADTEFRLDPLCVLKRRANGTLLTLGARSRLSGSGTLDGNTGGAFTGDVIDDTTGATVDGIKIINTPSASLSVNIVGTTGSVVKNLGACDGSIVAFGTQNVTISDNTTSGMIGVNWTSGSDMSGVWVERNKVSTNTSGSNEMIVVHSQGSAIHIKNVHVNFNRCVSNTTIQEGISLPGLQDFECIGNTVEIGSGSVVLGYEIVTCLHGVVSANFSSGAGTGFQDHDSQDVTFNHNEATVVGSGAKAFFIYSDSSRGVLNASFDHNIANLPSSVVATGFYIQSNNAAAFLTDISLDHNEVRGDPTVNTSTAIGIHNDAGTGITNVNLAGNKLKTCDVAVDYGGVTNLALRNNEATGTGRNLVFQSGATPTGLLINDQNSWNWQAAVPTVGAWFRGSLVWNTQAASGGIPGWQCVATGTPGTWRKMALLQTS